MAPRTAIESGLGALWVPETGIVDYRAVADAYAAELDAPSPGATASLAIGDTLADRAAATFGLAPKRG